MIKTITSVKILSPSDFSVKSKSSDLLWETFFISCIEWKPPVQDKKRETAFSSIMKENTVRTSFKKDSHLRGGEWTSDLLYEIFPSSALRKETTFNSCMRLPTFDTLRERRSWSLLRKSGPSVPVLPSLLCAVVYYQHFYEKARIFSERGPFQVFYEKENRIVIFWKKDNK